MHYSSGPGVIPHPLPEVSLLMVEIRTLKPYIFMIRVTRQNKCLIAQAPGVIPHPLPQVNFIMVEIPTPNHIYLWSRWIDKLNAPRVEARGHPHPLPEVILRITHLWNHFVNFNQTLPKCSLGDSLPKLFFSFLLICKARQMILTCNSAVASLMLSQFFLKRKSIRRWQLELPEIFAL